MRRHPAERLAALLLWLYPPAFRRDCGADVLQFVRTAAAAGPPHLFWMVGVDGLRSLAREWRATLSGSANQPPFNIHRSGESMRAIVRDFVLAARLLVKSPGFTIAAVLMLALGIGANTAIFTLAEAALLRPVRVHDPGRLVVWSWTSAYPDYQEYAKRTDVFEGVAAVGSGGRLSLVIDGAAEMARGAFVTGHTLDVLGVRAVHGRGILPADDIANGPIVAVLNHDYWRIRFAGDPGVVGRTIRLNDRPATIVGVLEPGFRGVALATNPALYLPTGVYNQVQTGFFSRVNALTAKGFVWLTVIGRLQPGVTPAQAAVTMSGVYGQLHPREPGEPPHQLELQTLPARALGSGAADLKAFVMVLAGVVGLTLLIGCANLANLLLARAARRRREIGVRLAIGATRGRVIRQMLSESLLLAGLGGAAGIGVAALALRLLSTYTLPGGIAIDTMHLEINGPALALTGGITLLTGVLFGSLPAWRASRVDVLASLREESRSATDRSGARTAFLAAQVALSLVLLVGAGLFARSLRDALDSPLGFEVHGVATASVNLGLARYDEGRARGLYTEALARVGALPQVRSAAWATMIPTRGSWVNQTSIEGYAAAPGEDVTVSMSQVGAGYFATVGARIMKGRAFLDTDAASTPPVAVVNEAMAAKYWPGRDPIGGRFKQFDEWVTVVGVVENAVVRAVNERNQPFAYLAFDQSLTGRRNVALDPVHLFVKTSGRAADVLPLVREQLRALDPTMPLYDVVPFEDHVAPLLMPQRMGTVLFTLFSALALALATIGIYGVTSYVTSARTREIGVRMALGASGSAVRRMVLLQGARPVALGIGVGLAIAAYATRLLESFLVGASALDPVTFAGVTAVLATISLAAIYVPARRASRIEPVQALRDE